MGFTAAESVPQETYDFAPYGGKGEIPEPSYEKITQFRKAMSAIYDHMSEGTVEPGEAPSMTEMLKYISQSLSHDNSEDHNAVLSALSGLTDIAYDELAALPYRLQQAFMGHITGLFLAVTRTNAILGL
jgi:hypothetical protein